MSPIDKVIESYTKYNNEEFLIITTKEQFNKFNHNYTGIDFDGGLNTYKGYWVILRNDMPINNEIVIMSVSDYNRNKKLTEDSDK